MSAPEFDEPLHSSAEAAIVENDLPYELNGSPLRAEAGTSAGPVASEVLRDDLRLRAQRHRAWVAGVMLGIVGLSGAVLFVGAWLVGAAQWGRLERASELFLGPMVALLGTAVGWYFSDRDR